MTIGRPLEYNKKVLSKSKEYIDSCTDEIENYHKTVGEKSNSYERVVRVSLPTIEGLAIYLNIARSTIYEWKSKYSEFSDTIEQLLVKQADLLINNGLSGNYNSTIVKLLLTKHGYKEEKAKDITLGNNIITGINFIRNNT